MLIVNPFGNAKRTVLGTVLLRYLEKRENREMRFNASPAMSSVERGHALVRRETPRPEDVLGEFHSDCPILQPRGQHCQPNKI